jgi:hypothetical protein
MFDFAETAAELDSPESAQLEGAETGFKIWRIVLPELVTILCKAELMQRPAGLPKWASGMHGEKRAQ